MERFSKIRHGGIQIVEVIPDDLKMVGDVLGMGLLGTAFGYRPTDAFLHGKTDDNEASERIVLSFVWGSQSDEKEEPVRITLQVPEGAWNRKEQYLIVNLDHYLP